MGHSKNASDDYFAGGRSLQWYIVAGSLMLTNLSTEQLVGLNGAVFADGCLAGIWWEAGAAMAMAVTASVFLPKYMALGLTTTSGFLGERFDLTLRTAVSVIFLVYYVAVLCPLVLYTGALAIRSIFDLTIPLWLVSFFIGVLGAVYALVGGLRAVAVSDCLNGIGLLIVGLWVPIAAMQTLPDGFSTLFESKNVAYLKPLVELSSALHREADGTFTRYPDVPSVPWHVTLTGLMLSNLYYWSTNQVIVQRVLAAKSLANGQKGVLFAATMKVIGFSMLCMPGIIAIVMQSSGVMVNGKAFKVSAPDKVFSEVVKAVMPSWCLGFFAAVLLGSVLSTFNSALNSASTIFGLEIYQVYIHPEATEKDVVNVAGIFGASLTCASFVIAPQLEHVGGIYMFLQKMNSIVSLPIVSVFFIGVATALPDAFSAKVGFSVAVLAVALGQFLPNIQFLHVFFVCFCVSTATTATMTYWPRIRKLFGIAPVPTPYCPSTDRAKVSMVAWPYLNVFNVSTVLLLALLVVSLELGLFWMFVVFLCSWALAVLALVLAPTRAVTVPVSTCKMPEKGKTKDDNELMADDTEMNHEISTCDADARTNIVAIAVGRSEASCEAVL